MILENCYPYIQALIKRKVEQYINKREETEKLKIKEMEFERYKEKERGRAATRKVAQFRDRVSHNQWCDPNIFVVRSLLTCRYNFQSSKHYITSYFFNLIGNKILE